MSLDVDTLNNLIYSVGYTYGWSKNNVVTRYKLDGSLDTTFGDKGNKFIYLPPNTYQGILDYVKVLSNGKLIVVASDYPFSATNSTYTVRLNPDGSLDSTFATNGIKKDANTNKPFGFVYADAKLDLNGNIIIASYNNQDIKYTKMFLSRVLPNGAPDLSFNKIGTMEIILPNLRAQFSKLAIDSNGNIMIAGSVSNANSPSTDNIIVKIKSDGNIDNSFSTKGYRIFVSLKGLDYPIAACLDQDNNIYYTGRSAYYGSNQDFIIGKKFSNGVIDTSFGHNGVSGLRYYLSGKSITYSPSSQIIVSTESMAGEVFKTYLAKYKLNGQIDSTFGINGLLNVKVQNSDRVIKHILDSDGNLVVAGSCTAEAHSYNINSAGLSIVKFKSNGQLDSMFGNNGKSIISPSNNYSFYGKDIKQDSKGNYIIIGFIDNKYPVGDSYIILKITKDGILDNTFGKLGFTEISKSKTEGSIFSSLDIDDKNRIVFIGIENKNLVVARLTESGLYDSTFNKNGFNIFSNNNESIINAKIKVLKDNRILALFEKNKAGLTSYYKSMITLEDGAVDTTSINESTITTGKFPDCLLYSNDRLLLVGYDGLDAKFVRLNLNSSIITSFKSEYDKSESFDVRISPNPSSGIFSINQDNAQILILSIDGKLIYNAKSYNKELINIDKKGLFILQIKLSDGKTYNKKLIIE